MKFRQLQHLRKKMEKHDLKSLRFELFGVDKNGQTLRRNYMYDYIKYLELFKSAI